MPNNNANPSKVALQIEEWKKRLIDLSRRNHLIFFDPSRISLLEIKLPSFKDVFARLFNSKNFCVRLPPENNNLSFEDANDKKQSDYHVSEGELAFALDDRKECERRIKGIFRRATSDYRERGIRTSVVIFGLLKWKENKDSNEEIFSPLLLYPVEIFQGTPQEPYKICESEEDVLLNPALQVKLNKDFKVQLPEPDLYSDDWALDEWVHHIERTGKLKNWRVEKRVFLGNFSFHKIAMYQDLSKNAGVMEQHPIVKGLTEGYMKDRLCMSDIPKERDLDNDSSSHQMLYILDADSSQSKAVESARCGQSFVLKGPPGTGKSQTIANIIAESLEDRKTVLFVSEKMAALEVVFNRLKRAGLTDYLLELHSHKADKKRVIGELARCLNERPTTNRKISSAELQRLKTLRDKLNDYVLQLHLVREPLCESMYQVLGRLSGLNDIQLIQMELPDDNFSSILFQTMQDLIRRLQNNYCVLSEGGNFPWSGFRFQRFTPTLRSDLLEMLKKMCLQVSKLAEVFREHSIILGVPCPVSFAGCKWILGVSKKLVNNPCPHKSWFNEGEVKRLTIEAQDLRKLSDRYHQLKSMILETYNDEFFNLPLGIKDKFDKAWMQLKTCIGTSSDIDRQILAFRKELQEFMSDADGYLHEFERGSHEIAQALDLTTPSDYSVNRVWQIATLAHLLLSSENRPERKWFAPRELKEAKDSLRLIQVRCEKHGSLMADITSKYNSDIFSVDIDRLLNAFDSKYKSILRFLIPRYYSDSFLMRKISKTKRIPSTFLSDLKNVKEYKNLENTLAAETPILKKSLGNYFAGFETNIQATESAIMTAEKIIRLAGALPIPDSLLDVATSTGIGLLKLKAPLSRLKNALSSWQTGLKRFGSIIGETIKLPIIEGPTALLKKFFGDCLAALKEFNAIVDTIVASKRNSASVTSCSQIIENLGMFVEIQRIETLLKDRSPYLNEAFGNKFSGLETNWQEVVDALAWTQELVKLTGETTLSDEFLENVTAGVHPTEGEISDLESECHTTESLVEQFRLYFADSEPLFPPRSVSHLDFDELIHEGNELISRIDELMYWLEWVKIATEIRGLGLGAFLEKIIAQPPVKENLSDIFTKAFYSAWTNKIFDEVPVLGDFRGANHDDMIAEFRTLDRKLNALSVSLIIDKLNENRNSILEGMRGSEVSVLRDQDARVRRRLPLRAFFSRIPNLLLKLKPCLLMSPLSVSHFIEHEKFMFDLVIFDEASQICTEDAVGAISRGTQIIVAGDENQLPPTKTSFFYSGETEDEDAEEADDTFGIYKSILEDCGRIGLTPQPLMLKWHYRSRHESLITYSNVNFYEHNLITFPNAIEKHDDLGIRFEYVSNGIYDRGGKKDNLNEAARVVELVFGHFIKYGKTKTLGVATLNIPQRDAIIDLIEQKRKSQPELNQFFDEDRLQGFFVKNLESVQGDERDFIILSLGYGRDTRGRLTMNFGPINKNGGEKRLNVIITRAREKLVLVTSINASDFDLTSINSEGPRHLYHYLDYAERGKEALELGNTVDGEVESPLEEDVKNEIRHLGYDAVSQVGCSAYRIDIGVIDPAHPGRFLLGVECDGACYHSAFTARERDRIRQDILESLGWKIHRIWSPDWLYRRNEETARLRDAIERARGKDYSSRMVSEELDLKICRDKMEPGDFKSAQLEYVTEYTPYKGKNKYPYYQFDFPGSSDRRADVLTKIVKHESPIHIELAKKRLLEVWGMNRTSPCRDDTADRTIRNCAKNGHIVRKGKFLYSDSSFEALSARKAIDNKPETFRDAEYVSEEEIQLSLKVVIKNAMSIKQDDLFIEVGKFFGWARRGSKVDSLISKAFATLLKAEIIASRDGLVSLNL